jgi:transcription-repair coupling factor (superfamily II helicase)
MVLKEDTLRCYFVNNPDSPYFVSPVFQSLLDYIQTRTNKARLKQTGRNSMLIVEDVKGMDRLHTFLTDLASSPV